MESTDSSTFDATPATGGQAPVALGPPEANAPAAEPAAPHEDARFTEAAAPHENALPIEATAPPENTLPTEAAAFHENAPPAPYRGGPRTEEGKRNARGNALKHGLTATTLLPEVLDPGLLANYKAEFLDEYRPATPTELVCVMEMARHAAALDRIEPAELAVLRGGAHAATMFVGMGLPLAGSALAGGLTGEEIMLAGAVGSPAVDQVTRYRRGHETALYTAQRRLEELQAGRLAREAKAGHTPRSRLPGAAGGGGPGEQASEDYGLEGSGLEGSGLEGSGLEGSGLEGSGLEGSGLEGSGLEIQNDAPDRRAATRFPSEDACAAYLAAWAQGQPFCCPQCGHDQWTWIATRNRRQCRQCRRQASQRHGTLMADSRLPLRTWFLAIGCLLERPEASAEEVAAAAQLNRMKTIRRMARSIRAAAASPEASRLLAGLDTVFARPGFRPPAPPVAAPTVGPLSRADAEPNVAPAAGPLAGSETGPAAESAGIQSGCVRRLGIPPFCETNCDASTAFHPQGTLKA